MIPLPYAHPLEVLVYSTLLMADDTYAEFFQFLMVKIWTDLQRIRGKGWSDLGTGAGETSDRCLKGRPLSLPDKRQLQSLLESNPG